MSPPRSQVRAVAAASVSASGFRPCEPQRLMGAEPCVRDKCNGQRPFQCRYCPYSASQKGNLKTHVLCVHRMPFDNSQYPDRRFKRSRVDLETSVGPEERPPDRPACSTQLLAEGRRSLV